MSRAAIAVFAVAFCLGASVAATNLASSLTSEGMTAVWVARERGLFKKHGLDP